MAKLKPRARIIRTVGDQLISGPEAALIELVKNAFDADSPFVRIKIAPPSEEYPTGLISVVDHGHGMPLEVIERRWFEPATDEKQNLKVSPRGRRMLGAKGIGRFAVSRLGSHTILRSVAHDNASRLEQTFVEIDWNDFTADKYLEEIDIPITHKCLSGMPNLPTGVSLQVTNIRDKWTKKKLEALIRELRRFTQHRNTNVYHFLPRLRLDKDPGGPFMVRFDKVRSIPRTDEATLNSLAERRVAAITPEFLPSLVERLGTFFSRIGTPDYYHRGYDFE